ncbi:MAG: OmpA family protein [Spongiibacteraceae bacterium]
MNTFKAWKYGAISAAMAGAISVVGCASAPKSDARLDAAHANFTQLQMQAGNGADAPVELKDASDALAAADHALTEDKDKSIVDNRIYLAQQSVAIAQQAYLKKMREKALAESADERHRIQLAARTAEAEKAKAALAELKAKMTERGAVLTLGDVLFDVGKSELKPGASREIDKLANFLRENPNRRVSIEGYTDSTGSDAFNQQLSEARAASVEHALIARDIDPSRIEIRGFGKEYAVAGNDSAAGRQLNRRVEVVISDENGHVTTR